MDKNRPNNNSNSNSNNNRNNPNNPNNRRGGQRGRQQNPRDESIDKKIVDIRRVARMYKGGKRMRLSVMVVVGDKKGSIGVGIGKGADVRTAEEKATRKAQKNMVKIHKKGNTIAHEITHKLGAARVFLKPAAPGTGIIAGGAVRAVVEVAGIKDILSKVLGSSNKMSNVYATIEALTKIKSA